jgi:hypothetical protein
MARFAVGAMLLLATSCAGAPPAPAPKVVAPACSFGDFRGCAAQCERGSAESCNNTGAPYEFGAGVTRDLDLAARYYARACGAGVATACENEARARAAKLEASVAAPQIDPPAPIPPTPSVVAPAKSDAPSYGTFASTGGMLGTWNATAGHCYSGANQSGGDMMSWAKFEEDAHGGGYSLRVGAESGNVDSIGIQRMRPYRSVDVSRDQCSRFEAKLRPQSDGSMAADVEIECAMPDGGKVTASIHDASCGDE